MGTLEILETNTGATPENRIVIDRRAFRFQCALYETLALYGEMLRRLAK